MHPCGFTFGHGLVAPITDDDSAKWEVYLCDAFGELDHVRFNTPVVEGKHFAGAPEAGDHLVGNPQHVVSVADLTDAGIAPK